MRQRTIGLLGGMSWESTVSYYRIINRVVAERLGGLHSAEILLRSLDFEPIERLQHEERWDEAAEVLARAARGLEAAGADFLLLCTNTMHRVADRIERSVSIPLLHIADETGRAVQRAGVSQVGLLGTRFTMEQDFLKKRLGERYGISVAVPPERDRERVHRVIYEELCRGQVREASRAEYRRIAAELAVAGAEAIVLGCTEISMLLRASDLSIPLFDTTEIHARAAALRAIEPDASAADAGPRARPPREP